MPVHPEGEGGPVAEWPPSAVAKMKQHLDMVACAQPASAAVGFQGHKRHPSLSVPSPQFAQSSLRGQFLTGTCLLSNSLP